MIFNIGGISQDNSLLLAIIAINMTVVGLTSLAETKNIIGVDYGKFLINYYKVFSIVRIYYLLIIFALINIVSLLCLFLSNRIIWNVNLIVLLFSLVFAIYYFFAYILIENKSVKSQIFEQELTCLYYKSDYVTNFEADKLSLMNNGSRTEKKLSSNVITYFDTFNCETQKTFEEVFGPQSIIYSNSNRIKKLYNKKINHNPYSYKDGVSNLNHISHEFFQLYRYSKLQEKWILEILRLFNEEYTKGYNDMRLNNILRILAHINSFGVAENLYKYKFLEYLTPYILDAIRIQDDTEYNKEQRINKESFLIKELCKYLFYTISIYNDTVFINVAENTLKQIISSEQYLGLLSLNDRVKILFEEVACYESTQVRELVVIVYNDYYKHNKDNFIGVDKLKKIINNIKKVEIIVKYKVQDIFV